MLECFTFFQPSACKKLFEKAVPHPHIASSLVVCLENGVLCEYIYGYDVLFDSRIWLEGNNKYIVRLERKLFFKGVETVELFLYIQD